MRGASASARGSRSGRRPSSRPPGSARRPRWSSKGIRERSIRSPRTRAISSTQRSTAESIPRPSRSILRKPASPQESLSHCTIWRPSIDGRLDRAEVDQRLGRDDHPARVLGLVARQAPGVAREPHERLASAASRRAGTSPSMSLRVFHGSTARAQPLDLARAAGRAPWRSRAPPSAPGRWRRPPRARERSRP